MLFTVEVDCTAGPLANDCLLGLAAQTERSFTVRLLDADRQVARRAELLRLRTSPDTDGEFLTRLDATDVPLAHWLATFARLIGDGVSSVSAATVTAAFARHGSTLVQVGPVTGCDVRTSARSSASGVAVSTAEITLLRRVPGELPGA